MKTSELIAVLGERLDRHGDREVVTTWEGITRPIEPRNVYLSKLDQLHIDADRNSYKPEFAVDPAEGGPEPDDD